MEKFKEQKPIPNWRQVNLKGFQDLMQLIDAVAEDPDAWKVYRDKIKPLVTRLMSPEGIKSAFKVCPPIVLITLNEHTSQRELDDIRILVEEKFKDTGYKFLVYNGGGGIIKMDIPKDFNVEEFKKQWADATSSPPIINSSDAEFKMIESFPVKILSPLDYDFSKEEKEIGELVKIYSSKGDVIVPGGSLGVMGGVIDSNGEKIDFSKWYKVVKNFEGIGKTVIKLVSEPDDEYKKEHGYK